MSPVAEPTRDENVSKADLPKGVVLDKDGKPCVISLQLSNNAMSYSYLTDR